MQRRWWATAAGVGLAAVLTPWRVEIDRPVKLAPVIEQGRALRLPPMHLDLRDVILIAADGPHDDIYMGEHVLKIGNRAFSQIADLKTFPILGGLMVMPLRRLPEGAIDFIFAPGITLDPSIPPLLAHQTIRFGLPCWTDAETSCNPNPPIPPPMIRPGEILYFTGAEQPYLMDGWSDQEPEGRWTDGTRARFRVALNPIPSGPITLSVVGHAIARPTTPPLRVEVLVAGEKRATWQIENDETQTFQASLSPADPGPGGVVVFTLRIADPRAPRDVYPGLADARPLGLFVRSIAILP